MSQEAHLHALAAQKIGRVLRGKWLLSRVLGVGGMGAVYEAQHENGKRVAVKMLHAHLATDARVLKRFVREGYVANALAHPSVVSIDDNDVDEEGNAFLVMELLYGQSLEERRVAAGGSLRPEEILPLFALLLDVLILASDLGIVHRDLKPENLFFHRDGSLRVVDFGLARAREISMSHVGALTNPDELLGTPAFMAPEQAIGRWDLVDPRTDVWAAGATLFTVLAGRPVHHGGSLTQIIVSAATRPAPPLQSLVPDIHPLLARAVDRSLAFSKAERPDARAALDDLRRAARALAIPLPPLPERPPPGAPVSSALLSEMPLPRHEESAKEAAVGASPLAQGSAVGRAARPLPWVVIPVAFLATVVGALAAAFVLRPPAAGTPARATATPAISAARSVTGSSPPGSLGGGAVSATASVTAPRLATPAPKPPVDYPDTDSELLLEKPK